MGVLRQYFWVILILGVVLASAIISFIFFLINRWISRAVSGKHKIQKLHKTSNMSINKTKNLAPPTYSVPRRTQPLIPETQCHEMTDADVHDYEENLADDHNYKMNNPDGHDDEENISDDHDYEENFLDNHDYEENIPDDHDYEENIPDDHDYVENIPDDHDYEENIPDDHDYVENIPDEHKTNKLDFRSFQTAPPNQIFSTHHLDYKPSLASTFHHQQSVQRNYVEVKVEEDPPSLTYEVPDPADDSQDDYDDIDGEDDYDDLG